MVRKSILAILVVVFAGTMVRADDKRGLFVGAGVGYGSQELDISTSDFQDNTTAWKGFVGYRFMRFIAVEAAYVDFGKASDTIPLGGGNENVDIKTTGETLEVVGILPLGDFFEIYGKAGALWWDSKIDSPSLSDTNSGSDNVYGAGARIIVAKKMGFRLEYERFDIKDTKTVYLTTVGFEWRF
jgi:OmpA-OmpF porin, OOP family